MVLVSCIILYVFCRYDTGCELTGYLDVNEDDEDWFINQHLHHGSTQSCPILGNFICHLISLIRCRCMIYKTNILLLLVTSFQFIQVHEQKLQHLLSYVSRLSPIRFQNMWTCYGLLIVMLEAFLLLSATSFLVILDTFDYDVVSGPLTWMTCTVIFTGMSPLLYVVVYKVRNCVCLYFSTIIRKVLTFRSHTMIMTLVLCLRPFKKIHLYSKQGTLSLKNPS